MGVMLSPGRRTVAAALRVMGLSGDRNYAGYHHALKPSRVVATVGITRFYKMVE